MTTGMLNHMWLVVAGRVPWGKTAKGVLLVVHEVLRGDWPDGCCWLLAPAIAHAGLCSVALQQWRNQ